jgi:Heparinase II/III N-terminus
VSTAASSRPGCHVRRPARMSPAGIAWRLRDRMVRATWSPREAGRYRLAKAVTGPARTLAFTAVLPPGTAARVPEEARRPVVEAADRLLQDRPTGPAWALSRLQHLTLLATAWFLTHDERYARRVAEHLSSCWLENPVLSGTHRVNGAELGIRLSSLAWIRRLLDDWPGTADLFERDALALRQIRRLQQYLAAFPSRGSSAGGHVIAEAAGRLVASCAFPWFRESERWRRKSTLLLERPPIISASSWNSGSSRPSKPTRAAIRCDPLPGPGSAPWPTARRPWSTPACDLPAAVIPAKAAVSCSTRPRRITGRPRWPWPVPWWASRTGGRSFRPTP